MDIKNNLQSQTSFGAIAIRRNINNPSSSLNKIIHSCYKEGLFNRGLTKQNENYTIITTKQGSEQEKQLIDSFKDLGIEVKSITDKKARKLINFYNKAKKILTKNEGSRKNPKDQKTMGSEYRKLFHSGKISKYYIE